jgi:hypothetical protein
MPTVLRIDGYSIQISTQDHIPAHVHVFARGCEAIINLNCLNSFGTLRENKFFKSRELKSVMRLVQANRAMLCEAWEEIHGSIVR